MSKPSFEIHKDTLGKFRFRVRDPSNKVIAFGEGCETKDGCINGIKDVKETVEEYHNAGVKDFTVGETTLILDEPQWNAKKDSTITFSGRLFGNSTGDGIEQAGIRIYESDGSFLKETPIAAGNTNQLGDFKIEWLAKKMDWWDNSVEIYAKFEGATALKPSRSETKTLFIS